MASSKTAAAASSASSASASASSASAKASISAAKASIAAASASARASIAAASAAAKVSVAAAKSSLAAVKAANRAGDVVKENSGLTLLATVVTILAAALAALYYSGRADEFFAAVRKRYFWAEAKVEAKALEKTDNVQAKVFLKDQLKKNPLMGKKELDEVSPGLGNEAVREGLATPERREGLRSM